MLRLGDMTTLCLFSHILNTHIHVKQLYTASDHWPSKISISVLTDKLTKVSGEDISHYLYLLWVFLRRCCVLNLELSEYKQLLCH